MPIQAIAFDVNGTLVDILTEDGMDHVFRAVGHYLTYQGIELRRGQVRDLYFQIMKEQLTESREEYPEFDAVAIWRKLVDDHMTDYTRSLPVEQLAQIPLFIAQLYRGVSRRKLSLYPYVREVLDALRTHYPLALVTDAQSAFARGELHKVGLLGYFNPIIVSGDFGYRKPDIRLFLKAIDAMGVAAADTLYIGNDMFHDVYGAREAGMKTLMYNSDQGKKEYHGTAPDYTITDYRELLKILGLPELKTAVA